MNFIPLNLSSMLRGLFLGRDQFTKTPLLHQNIITLSGGTNYVTVNGAEAELFNTTPQLSKVICKKAMMYSNGVFKHYRTGRDGKPEEIKDSEILKLLENPNPLQSRNEWLMEELIQTSVFGNSFIYGNRPFSSSDPVTLYNLPTDRMEVKTTGKIYDQTDMGGIISQYVLRNYDGTFRPFEVKDVMHSRLYNTDNPILGQSPFRSLQMPISNIRLAYGLRNIIMDKKGALGILTNSTRDVDGGIPLTETERKRLTDQYNESYGQNQGQDSIIITSSNLSWQPMIFETNKMMLFEEIDDDTRQIIDRYDMNEYVFSKEKGATFTNMIEGEKSCYQNGIIPYANEFTYKLSQFLGLTKKNEWVDLDYSHIEALQQSEKEKSEIIRNKAMAYRILKDSGMDEKDLLMVVGINP